MKAGVMVLVVGASLTGLGSPAWTQQRNDKGFDHPKHATLFPACVTCHEGAADASRPLWPDPATCAECHDGTIQRRVPSPAPAENRRNNLKFSHANHTQALIRVGKPILSATDCIVCHTAVNAEPMAVQVAVIDRCFTCHGISAQHFAAPDATCSTCHVSLARARTLARTDIARFSVPPSHRQPGFGGKGHGPLAQAGAQSCAVCHARDFCASCHVNAPDQKVIQLLEPDPRSLAIVAKLAAPASHSDERFISTHGAAARKVPAECSTCHARESCLTCHSASPRLAVAMPAGGVGRGRGAVITRQPPPSHTPTFREGHGVAASAGLATCTGCHARNQCLECHRPAAGAGVRTYHPAGFLERHPASAYARETSCNDCHNSGSFCTACHSRAGLATRVPIGAGYHDAKRMFLAGHGVAARQALESCVSCHQERDCLSCHAAVGGRRFNPHGPNFNAQLLRKKNPEMCTVCHGVSIPGGP